MADSSRIEDLRRRVQKDPASIAFAQLAEELRRAAQFEESIETCRAGLAIHPGYLSARVTLGRALVELNLLDDAQAELEHVLASAPENLAAIRGLAEISHRKGNLPAALSHYRSALTLAKNDPDLQETVKDLSKKVEPPKPPASADGLTFEQVARELSLHRPPPATVVAPASDFFATPALPDIPVAVSSAPPDVPASLSEAEPVAADVFASDFFATPALPDVPVAVSPAPPDVPASLSEAEPVAADAFASDFFATPASPDTPVAASPAPPDTPASLSEAAPVTADAFASDFFATPASPDTPVAASPAPPDVPASLSEAAPVTADAFASDFFATPASPDTPVAASPAPPDVPASLSEAAPVAGDAFASDFFATLSLPVPPAVAPEPMAPPVVESAPVEWIEPPAVEPIDLAVVESVEPIEPALAEWGAPPHESRDMPAASPIEPTPSPREMRVIAALEQWLEAIHVTREQHGA